MLHWYQGRGRVFAFSLALRAKNGILVESPFSVTLDKWLNFPASLFPHCERNVSLFKKSTLQDRTSNPSNLRKDLSIYRKMGEGRRRGLKNTFWGNARGQCRAAPVPSSPGKITQKNHVIWAQATTNTQREGGRTQVYIHVFSLSLPQTWNAYFSCYNTLCGYHLDAFPWD